MIILGEKQNTKRINMMRQFIDTAFQMAQEEGFNAITVRNLASKTNYNSSTIYYYFSNFDTLLTFVALKYLSQFFKELWHIRQNYVNSIDLFLKTFDTFIKFVIKYPQQFQALILNDAIELDEVLKIYYEIYPDGHIREYSTFPIIRKNGITSVPTLELCISHGHIKAKSRDKIIELMDSIFYTLIKKSLTTTDVKELSDIENRYNEYLRLFIQCYKTPIGILNCPDI